MDEQEQTALPHPISSSLARMLAEQENERRAVVRILQEDVGQALAALAVRLRVAGNTVDQAQSAALIAEARGLAAEALHGIDRLVHCLYPPALEAQGLSAALEVYAQDYAKRAQIRVELDLEVLPYRLPAAVELALFRIAQYALENARMYAYASSVQIALRLIDAFVCMTVADDGAGYPPKASPEGRALNIIQRAELLGGQARFLTMPGQGTHLEVSIPLESEELAP